MKFVIMSAILLAIISAVFNKTCFNVDCHGAENKCCKKLNAKLDNKGYIGSCVRKTESCPSGWEVARRFR